MAGDYIDGGDGDDCIVLVGPGQRIVIGGAGNDRTIQIPEGTSEATVQDIVAHCGDPDYLSALASKHAPGTSTSADVTAKPAFETSTSSKVPATATQAVAPASPRPGVRLNAEVDTGAIALLCGVLIFIAFLTTRWLR